MPLVSNGSCGDKFETICRLSCGPRTGAAGRS